MNFDKWYRSIYPVAVEADVFKLLQDAWRQSALTEREACVEIADEWAMSYVEVDTAALQVGKYIARERGLSDA